MFGYVKTDRGELRVREYEYYRASYCGLCRAMGKCTGQCSRMLLSYDFAYLSNIRMALCGVKPAFRRRRCLVHPLRPRAMMEPNEQLSYCAYATAILAFEKCRDNVADERGLRRFKARLQCFLLRRSYKKAKKALPALAECVRGHLARLADEEKKKQPSVDLVAAIFGDLLADVTAYNLTGDSERLARKIGWETGRFIYILDALDDLEKDSERGRFNPFLLRYGGPIPAEDKESIKDALISGLVDLETVFDLLPDDADSARQEILKNILYLGMPATLQRVLYGTEQQKEAGDNEQESL